MQAGPSKSLNRARTVLDFHRDPRKDLSNKDKLALIDNRLCPSCMRPAAGKKGGLVIAYGQVLLHCIAEFTELTLFRSTREAFFHVDCYKCKKCDIAIEINDRVLLDFDNLPLCEDCFPPCSACQLVVTENPVYVGSGGASYHLECFKCKKCNLSLQGQKFARGRASLYCEQCHRIRADKIKRRLEKKEERAKLAYGGIIPPIP